MSWLSENYEKASLGAAALIFVGLGFIAWQKLNSVEENFNSVAVGTGPKDPAVIGSDEVPVAISLFELDREVVKGDDEGRPVDLFTGVPLFVNKQDMANPVDIVKGKMVHEPIPNQWWIDNRIDPGFGDSPQRDEDEDGFTNVEEFEAKTDPADASNYPNLIEKLAYAGDEAVQWFVKPGFSNEDGAYTFKYSDTQRRRNKVGAASPIPVGGLFFLEGVAKNRFKFLGSEKREVMNEKLNTKVEVTIVSFEDQKPNKKGMVYEAVENFRDADVAKFAHFDRTAIFTLEALGENGKEIKIEERTEFALPPGAPEKNFKVTVITPEKVTVESKSADGKVTTYEILKGATGPAAE